MTADAVTLALPTHGLAPSGRMKVMMDLIGLSEDTPPICKGYML